MIRSRFAPSAVAIGFLILSAIHSPAPIIEQPTPAPAQSEAPKQKRSKKSTPAQQSPSAQVETKSKSTPVAQGPLRFAGTWTGTINQGVAGDITVSLSINANATSVQETSRLGTFAHPATIGGNLMTWKSGWLSEINWTFAPNNNGKTAAVTSKSPFGVNGSATFRRQ